MGKIQYCIEVYKWNEIDGGFQWIATSMPYNTYIDALQDAIELNVYPYRIVQIKGELSE